MSHTIITEPNPILHQVAKPVEKFEASLNQLVTEMHETMHENRGMGLAAPRLASASV